MRISFTFRDIYCTKKYIQYYLNEKTRNTSFEQSLIFGLHIFATMVFSPKNRRSNKAFSLKLKEIKSTKEWSQASIYSNTWCSYIMFLLETASQFQCTNEWVWKTSNVNFLLFNFFHFFPNICNVLQWFQWYNLD